MILYKNIQAAIADLQGTVLETLQISPTKNWFVTHPTIAFYPAGSVGLYIEASCALRCAGSVHIEVGSYEIVSGRWLARELIALEKSDLIAGLFAPGQAGRDAAKEVAARLRVGEPAHVFTTPYGVIEYWGMSALVRKFGPDPEAIARGVFREPVACLFPRADLVCALAQQEMEA